MVQKYLVGSYDVEVLTVPRRKFDSVKIEQIKITNLSLPDSGILNIVNNAARNGSIYEIMEDGHQQWVYDLDDEQPRSSVTLQPGNYKIVFRVDGAPGSKYTTVKNIKIEERRSAVLRLFV